jgi:hypothetical protein
MAENINIKVLIDAADAAKTVQETRKAMRDLRAAAMSVEEGSTAFTQINTAAGQLQDRLGDLASTVSYLGDDLKNLKGLSSIAQGIAGGFAIAQGAAALFGSENKQVEESLMRVQSAMSLLQGVQAVGEILQKESAATLFVQNGLRKTAIALTSEQTVAQAAEAVAAGTATVAQRALNAAINANPVMVLVSALVIATTALLAFTNGSEESAEAEEKARKETEARTKAIKEQENAVASFIAKEQSGYLLLTEQLKETNPKSKERLELIEKINQTYGTTLKNLQDEELFQNQVNKSVEDYITFLKLKYSLQANEKAIQNNIAEQSKLQNKLAKEQASLNESIEARKRAGFKDTGRDLRIELASQFEIISEIEAKLNAADERLQAYVKNSMNTQSKISLSGLKLSGERVANEDKNNKKSNDNYKKSLEDKDKMNRDYADSVTSINEYILNNDIETSKLSLESWNDSYIKRLAQLQITLDESNLSIKKSLNEEVQSLIDTKGENIVLGVDVQFNSEGVLTGLTKSGSDFLSSNKEIANKVTEAYLSSNRLITANTKSSLREQERLYSDQMELIREEIKKTTEIALATDEYKRYFDYIIRESNKISKAQFDRSVERFNSDSDAIIKSTKRLGEKTFDEIAESFFEKIKSGSQDVNTLTNSLNTLRDTVESNTLNVSKINGQLVIENLSNDISKAKDELRSLFDLSRTLDSKDVGQTNKTNLLLASLYKDKYDIITKSQSDINKSVENSLDVLSKGTDEASKKAYEQIKSAGILGKKFAVEVTDAQKQFGLSDLIKYFGPVSKELEKSLSNRYDLIVENEKKTYDDALYAQFTRLQDGKITKEEYDKEIETIELNHKENLLLIDVTYGKKGQKEMIDNQNDKAAALERAQQKEIDQKKRYVDEMLELESILQNGIMNLINQSFQSRVDNMNIEYDLKVSNIQRELKAYEMSLQQQSVEEIQIANRKKDFQDRIDEQNKQRAAEERRLKIQQFNAQKSSDMVQAGINGALAFTRALALTGPYALAIQGLVAAQVASQIFFISSQQPNFADGGLVVGPGGPKDDKIKANLSNGESVINAKSTKMFAPVLSMINQAGGGKAIPSQGSKSFSTEPMFIGERSLSVDNSDIIEELKKLNNRPIEAYVKESSITSAQNLTQRENRRTSF